MHDAGHSQRPALHSKRNQRTEHPSGGAFRDSDGEIGTGNRRCQLQGNADEYQNLRTEQLPFSQHNVSFTISCEASISFNFLSTGRIFPRSSKCMGMSTFRSLHWTQIT